MAELKKFSEGGIISLTSTFHKDKTKNDGLGGNCKPFRKNKYKLIQTRLKIYQKNYIEQPREKKFLNQKEKRTDVNFQLFRKTRRKIYQALNAKLK